MHRALLEEPCSLYRQLPPLAGQDWPPLAEERPVVWAVHPRKCKPELKCPFNSAGLQISN
ncbi:hypothetical protein DESC_850002 [Desulfosarcina cetonica]|nr:hypothetical protein DESC_850002 [Desulfosarcina cetonica]